MALPPLQPVYILRGHAAQVHALAFSPTNSSLLSGDAEGYVVCWSLASKRATASWRAHTNAVLGVAWWTEDIIVSHGRDSQLHIWKLGPGLDTVLPVDKNTNLELAAEKTPVLLHSMTVNTLNFCAFTWTRYQVTGVGQAYLLALPHTLSSEAIDIFQLTITSSESDMPTIEAIRKTTIPPPDLNNPRTGLTMCLSLQKDYNLLAGYESGHTIVYSRERLAISENDDKNDTKSWDYKPSYISRPHSQPILSIQSTPGQQIYITTAADSKLATHRVADLLADDVVITETAPCHSLNTRHSGQQGLSIRDDGLLLATAGWDSRGRVYKAPSVKATDAPSEIMPPKEIAVLKWHKEGCYCTAFAHVLPDRSNEPALDTSNGQVEETKTMLSNSIRSQIETTAQRRELKARKTHWLALGSKDGKISLWDIP